MDSEQREELKALLERHDNPAVILDGSLECVYSNSPSLLPIETKCSYMLKEPPPLPITGVCTSMVIADQTYCARIIPLGGGFSLCELFSADALMRMAERTDYHGRFKSFFNVVEHNAVKLWMTLFAMRDHLKNGADVSDFASRFGRCITELSSAVKNAYEYSDMMTSCDPAAIDICTLAEGLVKRCNTILSECGRCISFTAEERRIFVAADVRHAVAALTNSIQNALLYSPRDSVPVMTVSSRTENGRRSVCIQLVNDSSLFVDKDGERDLRFQRSGLGIPIIRRFAEEAGGSLFLDNSGTRVKLAIVFPEADTAHVLEVKEGGYSYYDTGIPDIVEVKMREVVGVFT